MTKAATRPATNAASDAATRPARRQVLQAMGAGLAGILAGQPSLARILAPQQPGPDQPGPDQSGPVQDAPLADPVAAAQRVPFYGTHQAGIVTPRPANGIMASFDVVASTLDDVERMLKALTERAAFLTMGGPVPERDPKLPPADSGLLGPVVSPDNQTITLALGESLFDKLPELRPLKPIRLQRMVQFPNDALESALCHGDISIQFCANIQDANIHALRDIVKNLSEFLVMRWMVEGSVPPELPDATGKTASARNFLGFRDGSANPDSSDAQLMDRVVWVNAPDEPEWAHGGSYQAVRIIRNMVERWDRTPPKEQEDIFGRRKDSGAPMDGGADATEHDVPDYAADPDAAVTFADSHIRLANPRTPGSDAHLMLRRPFNYSRGVLKNGQLDQGLLFICYQADLEKGFIHVQNLLNGEPLEEYIKPIGGGYFFAVPGVREAGDYLGSRLIDAARRA